LPRRERTDEKIAGGVGGNGKTLAGDLFLHRNGRLGNDETAGIA
jgi:hypothetical protein